MNVEIVETFYFSIWVSHLDVTPKTSALLVKTVHFLFFMTAYELIP